MAPHGSAPDAASCGPHAAIGAALYERAGGKTQATAGRGCRSRAARNARRASRRPVLGLLWRVIALASVQVPDLREWDFEYPFELSVADLDRPRFPRLTHQGRLGLHEFARKCCSVLFGGLDVRQRDALLVVDGLVVHEIEIVARHAAALSPSTQTNCASPSREEIR